MSVAQTAQQILFQDSLAEVVRQLRNSKKNEKEVIMQAIEKIKKELTSSAQHVKVIAVVKLAYFAMLGYNSDYGAFNIIEVMADTNFQNKRAGYVAAAACFHEDTPVLPLCTALLKRDLTSVNQYEVGLALYCISCVCTPDLARDLVSDIVGLLDNQRAYIRKKAVLCLYKIFLQFPDALRPTYPLLKDKLEDGTEKSDNDPAVRGAVVNVLCEMARRNPANFLNLVVPFFSLLSSVHNNWTLIKIVKVFGHFAPLEPRLGKKLVEPITNLINTTPAKSVQYECVYAVASGMSKVTSLLKLAADKMKTFVEDPDQNLKYLGLDAMTQIMKENPKILADQRDTILACLDDPDQTIRLKALELLRGMVSKKNVVSTIASMLEHCARFPPDEEWSNMVIETILLTAQTEDYDNVQDFEWYLGILMDLAQVQLTNFKHGHLIEQEFITILTRVHAVRQFGVESLCMLLSNEEILTSDHERSSQWLVLKAAAFLCGEYPYWLPNKRLTVQHLLHERVASLPAELQVIYVTASWKIHAYIVNPCGRHKNRHDGEEELQEPEDPTTIADVNNVMFPAMDDTAKLRGLALFSHSVFPDVQECAQLVSYLVEKAPQVSGKFFEAELDAVVADAQSHVAVPEGLDLDAPFADTMPALVEDDDDDFEASQSEDESKSTDSEGHQKVSAKDHEAVMEAARRHERERRNEVDVFYIRDETPGKTKAEEELPPVQKLETIITPSTKPQRSSGKKAHTISKTLSKPVTYSAAAKQKQPVAEEDEATKKLRNINVSKPLDANVEKLPVAQPYVRIDPTADSKASASPEPSRYANFTNPAVTVLETKHIRVSFTVDGCKLKHETYQMTVTCTVVNMSSSNSLYTTMLAVNHEHVRVTNGADPQLSSILLCDRLKGGTSTTTQVDMSFSPEFSFAQGVPLRITFTRDKKQHENDGTFTVKVRHFMNTSVETSVAAFNETILPALAQCPSVGGSIPLPPKAAPKQFLTRIQEGLALSTVDVFKDCCTLYGQIVARKTQQADGNLAVLLKEEEIEGAPHMSVFVKCLHVTFADAVIQEISGIVCGE